MESSSNKPTNEEFYNLNPDTLTSFQGLKQHVGCFVMSLETFNNDERLRFIGRDTNFFLAKMFFFIQFCLLRSHTLTIATMVYVFMAHSITFLFHMH